MNFTRLCDSRRHNINCKPISYASPRVKGGGLKAAINTYNSRIVFVYAAGYFDCDRILRANVTDFTQSVFPLNATTKTPISRDKLNSSNSVNEKVFFRNIPAKIPRITCNKIFEDLFKVFTIGLHNKIFEDLQESDKVTAPATSACRNQWKKSST